MGGDAGSCGSRHQTGRYLTTANDAVHVGQTVHRDASAFSWASSRSWPVRVRGMSRRPQRVSGIPAPTSSRLCAMAVRRSAEPATLGARRWMFGTWGVYASGRTHPVRFRDESRYELVVSGFLRVSVDILAAPRSDLSL
jgi:hypothetical protein